MAGQFLLLFSFIFFINLSLAQRPIFPNSIVIPLTKDVSAHQYVAKVHVGTPLAETKLVMDINGPFLWLDCADSHTTLSSSQHAIYCSSLQCSMANANNGCITASKVDDDKICSLQPENTIKKIAASGGLAEDVLAVKFRDGSNAGAFVTIHHFLFSCAPSVLLEGLASGVKGMLGFGNTRISLPSQLSARFGFERKSAMCLSSSNGVILAGDGPYVSSSGMDDMDAVGLVEQSSNTHEFPKPKPSGMDISKSLMYTPLISYQGGISEEYYINVKSIKINGLKLSVNSSLLSLDEKSDGGTKISTIVPYTAMKITIYEAFVKAYVEAAVSMNVAMVEPVAPFGVCFSLDGLKHTMVGPKVPTIDFVLQSEMVKWRIHGRNSMVQVSDGVMCLGFFNGGFNQKASIVIGGHQLEEYLLEFNLGTSMLGFASLLLRQKSCSDFDIGSLPLD